MLWVSVRKSVSDSMVFFLAPLAVGSLYIATDVHLLSSVDHMTSLSKRYCDGMMMMPFSAVFSFFCSTLKCEMEFKLTIFWCKLYFSYQGQRFKGKNHF